jgi:2-oxoglutarate ferredoxin oxidoreductase subunit beta
MVYGMTGGQSTPTTPQGVKTATAPAGNTERPFDLARLVAAAGATYVSRYSVWHVRPLIASIKKALQHPGFSFIEVLSTCPTQFGRRNEQLTPAEMLRSLKQNCLTLDQAQRSSPQQLVGKIAIGEFVGDS